MFKDVITRRGFIKDLAVAGGTLAIGASSAGSAGQTAAANCISPSMTLRMTSEMNPA
jgi:hypothetical protein